MRLGAEVAARRVAGLRIACVERLASVLEVPMRTTCNQLTRAREAGGGNGLSPRVGVCVASGQRGGSLRARGARAVVLATICMVLVVACTNGEPDDAELQRRLDAVEASDALRTPVSGATLLTVDSELCRDSEPPSVQFRYSYAGDFDEVLAFYVGHLKGAGWRRTNVVAFEDRRKGWVAEAIIEDFTSPRAEALGTRGYGIWVRVDDGYMSGC